LRASLPDLLWAFQSFKKNEDATTQLSLQNLMNLLQNYKNIKMEKFYPSHLKSTILPATVLFKIHSPLKLTKICLVHISSAHLMITK
jgi:hypothetical protein